MVDYFYYDYVISWMELLHIVVSWVLMSWTIVPSWEEIMVLDIDSSYVMGRESLRVKKRQPTHNKERLTVGIIQSHSHGRVMEQTVPIDEFEIVELKSCRIAIMLQMFCGGGHVGERKIGGGKFCFRNHLSRKKWSFPENPHQKIIKSAVSSQQTKNKGDEHEVKNIHANRGRQ